MSTGWQTAVTAHTVTRDGPLWLMVRHLRLGVAAWEVPGGHVEPGETLEQAAARETLEETGVRVRIGPLLATCVHEWAERRQRRLVCFFDASPLSAASPYPLRSEPSILEAAWADPRDARDAGQLSAFLGPLIALQDRAWADAPIHFAMTHRRGERGQWEPAPA